jgi:hypothetical protein
MVVDSHTPSSLMREYKNAVVSTVGSESTYSDTHRRKSSLPRTRTRTVLVPVGVIRTKVPT